MSMATNTKQAAIVTGGSRGIGRAIVDRLLADNFDVMSCGRSDRPDNFPENAPWVRPDVANSAEASALIKKALATFGHVSVLINNAGVQVEKSVLDSTDDDWDLVVGVNCRGVFNMSRACLPSMQEHGGNIINIGSISGNVADATMALYNGSKAFVHGLTRSIALDHGPNVRCNAIQPGWIMTAMASEGFALADNAEAAMQDAIARHPVGRLGEPCDIANMVSFLVSDSRRHWSQLDITVFSIRPTSGYI